MHILPEFPAAQHWCLGFTSSSERKLGSSFLTGVQEGTTSTALVTGMLCKYMSPRLAPLLKSQAPRQKIGVLSKMPQGGGLLLPWCEDSELNVICGADTAPSPDVQSVGTLILNFSASNPEQYISNVLQIVQSSLGCSLIARMWGILGPVSSSHTFLPSKILQSTVFVATIHTKID